MYKRNVDLLYKRMAYGVFCFWTELHDIWYRYNTELFLKSTSIIKYGFI